jgi:biopolymer transport protein ExbD
MSRPKKRVGIKMDMTPFVDVAFLLLIFFMTTTSFKPPAPIEVQLPSSHVEIQVPESNVIVISVGRDGELAFQEGLDALNAAIVQMSDMKTLILNKRAGKPGLRFAIRADKNAQFGVMSDLMKVMQETNTTRFNLVTDYEEDVVPAPAVKR